jgi:hypothetical protein
MNTKSCVCYQLTGFGWGPGGSEPPTPPSSSLSVFTKRTFLGGKTVGDTRFKVCRRGGNILSVASVLGPNMVLYLIDGFVGLGVKMIV